MSITVPAFGYRKRKHKDTGEVQEHTEVESGCLGGVNELQNVHSESMNQNGVSEMNGNTKLKKKKKDSKGFREKGKNK